MNRINRPLQIFALFVALTAAVRAADSPAPQWIWHPNDGAAATNGEIRFFRKTFTVEGNIKKAMLAVAADNSADVFLNEELAVIARGYEHASYTDVTKQLQ